VNDAVEGLRWWRESQRSEPDRAAYRPVWIQGAPADDDLELRIDAGWATWRAEHQLVYQDGRWWFETFGQVWTEAALDLAHLPVVFSTRPRPSGLLRPGDRSPSGRPPPPVSSEALLPFAAFTSQRGGPVTSEHADLASDPRLAGPEPARAYRSEGLEFGARTGPDGRRVLLHRFALDGPLSVHVVGSDAWVAWTGRHPFLHRLPRGPLTIRSELHHRQDQIDDWDPGQPQALWLEPEPRLRIHRSLEVREERGSTDVSISVTADNDGPGPLSVHVQEVLPQSADPLLDVQALELEPDGEVDGGWVRWQLVVPSQRRRSTELRYRVSTPPRHQAVVVPGGTP
jgi:hypothetical protein